MDQRYNDDLLLDESSREHAKAEFPLIFHVLDDPDLRAVFRSIDTRAAIAKRRSQRSGCWAVLFAVLSLAGAAAEPLWRDSPEPWSLLAATGAAALGLVAVSLAAFGVLHGKQKDLWLHHRLCTERLRQLHFQAFIWKLPEIAASCRDTAPDAHARFAEDRRETVAAFVHRLDGQADAGLTALLDPAGASKLWLYEASDSPPPVPPGFVPTELFSAYRRLRFEEQLAYADHKLRAPSFAPRFRTAPLRSQRRMLRGIWTLAFGAMIALHIVLVVGHLANWEGVRRPLVHVGIVWLALIVLGARTLEEGLGLSREIERHQDYRTAVLGALERFNRADTAEDMLRAMMDMERLSFDEMRSFLRTTNESSFVV